MISEIRLGANKLDNTLTKITNNTNTNIVSFLFVSCVVVAVIF